MPLYTRIQYKIVEEDGRVLSGIRTVEGTMDAHIGVIRKDHPDARLIYVEYIGEEMREAQRSVSSEGVIIICLGNAR